MKEAAKVKINTFSSCDEHRRSNSVHQQGSILVTDCHACLGGETVRIYRMAMKKNGEREQLAMLSEECAELSAAANHVARGRTHGRHQAFIKELADVEIMIEQMKLHFDLFEDVREMKEIIKMKLEVISK